MDFGEFVNSQISSSSARLDRFTMSEMIQLTLNNIYIYYTLNFIKFKFQTLVSSDELSNADTLGTADVAVLQGLQC